MRKTGQKHMGFKKGGATEPKYTVKDEVKSRMRKETPRTGYGIGLSPVTQYRRYKHKKNIEKERARDDAKVKKMMSGGFGIFSKSKNVEAGEPDKKKKKNVIKENVTKKQKRLEELKKELGMKAGGIKQVPGRKKPRKPVVPPRGTGPTRPKPKLPPYLKKMQEKKSGMKKGGMKKADGVMLIIEKKAAGGITGKTTFGELSKRKPLKKGIRLKGKGSSFMKEYKKRVYNRAGGGSVNGGARGTGIAVKGHNFKGVF